MVGKLIADPEFKYTPNGKGVASFKISVQRFTKNESGFYDSDLFPVNCWNKTAEYVNNYIKKGSMVSVNGRLQTRSWTAEDGSKRYMTEIVAENVHCLDKREYTDEKPAPKAQVTADDVVEDDPFADE
jgi:single-strand DNA-binding protein